MFLNELELIDLGKIDLIDDIKSYWKEQRDKKLLSKIGSYEIYNSVEQRSYYFFLYDPIRKRLAGGVTLYKKGKSFSISLASVDTSYFGLGLMTKLYAFLILKLNYTLISDSSQSRGGRSIWEKLIKVKGINVYAWDNKKKVAHSLDKNDPFGGDTEIYNQDVTDESYYGLNEKIFQLRNLTQMTEKDLFNFLRKIGPTPFKEQKAEALEKDKELKRLRKELKTMERDIKDLGYVTDHMTLVACRER